MQIMGVDLSIACTGVALPGGRTLAIKPKSTGHARMREITDQIMWQTRTTAVDLVVIEGLGGVYKGEASRIIPMLHGALINDLLRAGTTYMWLPPSSVKKFATGNGSADKTLMALAAYKRLGTEYATGDECDADWCRVAGYTAYGRGVAVPTVQGRVLKMPASQVRGLFFGAKGQRIEWPQVGLYTPVHTSAA